MSQKPDKVDVFFNLLRGQYGVGKYKVAFPTDQDEQVAKALWRNEIERHSESELAGALATVRRMMASNSRYGEKADEWVNIGLILSCVEKRSPPALPASRDESKLSAEEREKIRLWRIEKMEELKKATGLFP